MQITFERILEEWDDGIKTISIQGGCVKRNEYLPDLFRYLLELSISPYLGKPPALL